MAAGRSVWKGQIQFSMVSVPVAAYTAAVTGGGGITFNQLHRECNTRIKYQKVCPVHGEVRSQDIVSGYEFTEGQYVVVDPAEIERLRPAKDKAVRIEHFVKPEAVDPRFFNGRTYYLLPEGAHATKPYVLLQRVMAQQKRVAFAQVVMGGHDQLVLLRPLERFIAMTFLNYAEELKPVADFNRDVPDVEVSPKEMDLAKTLTAALEAKDFEVGAYRDHYTENVRKLIEAKVAGREVVIPEQDDAPAPVINLMEALERSLAQAAKAKKPPKLAAPSAGRAAGASATRRRKNA